MAPKQVIEPAESVLRSQFVHPARDWLQREYPALPVDVFRILVGVLASSFFVRLLVEFPEISHPLGLIDHALTQDIYWFTRIGLFQPWTPVWVIAAAYWVGLAGSLMVAAGYRVRAGALAALIVAASAYRWNFVVMYLDDAVVHLMIFWMLLLPTGRTATLQGWLQGDQKRQRWMDVMVPGATVRCLLLNVVWIYLLAGAWKLDSVLWRDGFGLYAAVKVEVARMPDVWGPRHLAFLEWSDYLVLALEPVLPLPMLLGRRWMRLLGALSFAVFNLFILTTLGIVWAILGLTCTLVLFLGEDAVREMRRRTEGTPPGLDARQAPKTDLWGRAERAAIVFITVLAVATARHIPLFGALNQPAYAVLWMVGVAQDYRLFNWIDRVAYQVRTTVEVRLPDGTLGALPDGAYPDRFRAKLLQAYAHDIRWLLLPDERRFALRLSIAQRQASWLCRFVEDEGTRIEIISTVHPIRRDNLDFATRFTIRLADFSCVAPGTVSIEEGGVPVPDGWPHLQARFIQGLNRLD